MARGNLNLPLDDLSETTLVAIRNDLLTVWSRTGKHRGSIELLNRILGFAEDDRLVRDARGVPLVCVHNMAPARRYKMEKELRRERGGRGV